MDLLSNQRKWIRIKLAGVNRLVTPPGRWRWETDTAHGRKRLLLRSPHGALWHFKLNGGSWLRRVAK